MKISAKEAKETIIFAIEDDQIYSEPLYDFVMKSAEETTSPVGVMQKLHIRHEDYSCRYGKRNAVNNSEGLYEVWIWGPRGNGQTFLDSFETEEEAEDYIFNRTYEYDFATNDQRDTSYYFSEKEAKDELICTYAERHDIDIPVAESIFHKKELIEAVKLQRYKQAKEKAKQSSLVENERINVIAAEYAKMISAEAGESYKQTAARLSAAIGEKIEGRVFHAAVKMIRCK